MLFRKSEKCIVRPRISATMAKNRSKDHIFTSRVAYYVADVAEKVIDNFASKSSIQT